MLANPVLVFDGDCGFCSAAVSWLGRRVSFRAVPSRAVEPSEWGLSGAQLASSVWLLDGDAKAAGADAIAALLRHSPRLGWRLVGRALGLPLIRNAARLGYRVCVRYRHLLPGGTRACSVPSLEAHDATPVDAARNR